MGRFAGGRDPPVLTWNIKQTVREQRRGQQCEITTKFFFSDPAVDPLPDGGRHGG